MLEGNFGLAQRGAPGRPDRPQRGDGGVWVQTVRGSPIPKRERRRSG